MSPRHVPSEVALQRAIDALPPAPTRANPPSEDEPTVAQRLKWLSEYLSLEVDPYDFARLIPEYYESLDEVVPAAFDADEPWSFLETDEGSAITADFTRWLKDGGFDPADEVNDAHAPAYLHFSVEGPPLPADTWLVHFSDKAHDIARIGFAYGHAEDTTLGLTTWFVDAVRHREPGWNFALEAESSHAAVVAHTKKYGRHAVLFQAEGLPVYHYGDEERQVIVWGPSVRRFILLERGDDGWSVVDPKTGDPVHEGRFLKVVRWAIEHASGAKPRIVSTVKKPRQPVP